MTYRTKVFRRIFIRVKAVRYPSHIYGTSQRQCAALARLEAVEFVEQMLGLACSKACPAAPRGSAGQIRNWWEASWHHADHGPKRDDILPPTSSTLDETASITSSRSARASMAKTVSGAGAARA